METLPVFEIGFSLIREPNNLQYGILIGETFNHKVFLQVDTEESFSPVRLTGNKTWSLSPNVITKVFAYHQVDEIPKAQIETVITDSGIVMNILKCIADILNEPLQKVGQAWMQYGN